jgi:hypothetical protein
MALLRLWSNFCATGWYWPSCWALIFAVISVDGGSTLTEVGCGSSSRLDLKRSFCPKRYVPKRVFGHVSSGGSILPDPSFAELPGCTPVDTMITALYQLVSDVWIDMHYDRIGVLTHLLYWMVCNVLMTLWFTVVAPASNCFRCCDAQLWYIWTVLFLFWTDGMQCFNDSDLHWSLQHRIVLDAATRDSDILDRSCFCSEQITMNWLLPSC